ncbi:hypothetical protein [Pseudomonas sp. CHM02]|uniref:hypothetical protein n=1 Tax=Pseudomonas sp. CHM02 TaxID=1463662 RepID=UPI0004706405|nr:hypothetical protein [Pseudomonas sp. CHM02]
MMQFLCCGISYLKIAETKIVSYRKGRNALPVGKVWEVRAKEASVMECGLERRIDCTDDYYRTERLLDFHN